MAPVALTCPLCCNETFSSHDSLKYHILSMIDNLLCPSCNERCDDLMDLADHLGRECANIDLTNQENNCTVSQNNEDGKNTQDCIDNLFIENIKKEVDDNYTESQKGLVIIICFIFYLLAVCFTLGEEDMVGNGEQEEETSQSGPKFLYTCQMCNISFNSVKNHLLRFHEGEEVLLVSK